MRVAACRATASLVLRLFWSVVGDEVQVGCRANGQEFGESLDESEQERDADFYHCVFARLGFCFSAALVVEASWVVVLCSCSPGSEEVGEFGVGLVGDFDVERVEQVSMFLGFVIFQPFSFDSEDSSRIGVCGDGDSDGSCGGGGFNFGAEHGFVDADG